MMKRKIRLLRSLLFITLMMLGLTASAEGSLTLSPVFSDAMVLQRAVQVPVWGDAEPGLDIRVSFANQTHTTQATEQGRWRITLSPMKASAKPQVLQVIAGDNQVTIKNVLIGEVWLLAGQSNMAFPLGSCVNGKALAQAIAKNQAIRLMDPEQSVPGGPGAWTLETCQRLSPQNFFRPARWAESDLDSASGFSGVGGVFGLQLQEKLGVPVGLIDVSVGGSPAQSWLPRETVLADPALAPLECAFPDTVMVQDFVYNRPRQQLGSWLRAGRPSPVPEHPYRAGFLYEAGLKPYAKLPIAGILWYQGESNADDASLHNKLFTTAVESWRELFNNKDLPVFWVQLPELNRESWPEFREAQEALTQTIPNTAMAVALGCGHPTDVHPRDKAPIGDRLARLALNRVYGVDVEDSGPVLSEARRVGASMQLSFDHLTGGMDLRLPGKDEAGRDQTTGFWIAGQDKVFHPAYLEQKQGDTLWLSNPAINKPVAVRYAWEANVKPTLFNGEGLPGAPFRTDDWQPIRVACVGDSITFGTGTSNPDSESYPAQLSQMIGPLFDVRRFGVPGASVLDGLIQPGTGWNRGYISQRAFHRSIRFEPNVVIINLGINDVVNEDFNTGVFVADYIALINAYKRLPSRPRVIIWGKLAPLFPGQRYYSNDRLKLIQKALDIVVEQTGVISIDMYQPLKDAGQYFPDKLHPDARGAELIATAVRNELKRCALPVAELGR